jgi:hypothetical protein
VTYVSDFAISCLRCCGVVPNHFRWIAKDDAVGLDVSGDNGTGTHHCIITYCHALQDHRAGPQPDISADDDFLRHSTSVRAITRGTSCIMEISVHDSRIRQTRVIADFNRKPAAQTSTSQADMVAKADHRLSGVRPRRCRLDICAVDVAIIAENDSPRTADIELPGHAKSSTYDDSPAKKAEFDPVVMSARQTHSYEKRATRITQRGLQRMLQIHCKDLCVVIFFGSRTTHPALLRRCINWRAPAFDKELANRSLYTARA